MRKLNLYQSRWIYVILALLVLTACGQKEQTTNTSSSGQTNTTKMSTSSSESTSSTKATSASSSQTEATSTPTNEGATSPSSSAPINKTESYYIPSILVGEWVGSSPQADRITLSISGNGLVTSSATFKDGGVQEWRAIINSIDTVGNDTFFITSYSGDYNALLPGVTGLGGAGSKVAFGFKIENAQLIPVNWVIPENEAEFNYESIHTFGYALGRH